MASSLDVFSELLFSLAHIQTLLAREAIPDALGEINDALENVRHIGILAPDTRDKLAGCLTGARECLTHERGRLAAADHIWQAYVALKIS